MKKYILTLSLSFSLIAALPTTIISESPVEQLMMQHGVTNRVLAIYEELVNRLHQKTFFKPEWLITVARIAREYIEDFHQKIEEQYIFPQFAKMPAYQSLITLLKEQHAASRTLTNNIKQLAATSVFYKPDNQQQLLDALTSYILMVRAHEMKEDTQLFPTLRSVMKKADFVKIGQLLKNKEHDLFGRQTKGSIFDKLTAIEKELGLHDIACFTPHFDDAQLLSSLAYKAPLFMFS